MSHSVPIFWARPEPPHCFSLPSASVIEELPSNKASVRSNSFLNPSETTIARERCELPNRTAKLGEVLPGFVRYL